MRLGTVAPAQARLCLLAQWNGRENNRALLPQALES